MERRSIPRQGLFAPAPEQETEFLDFPFGGDNAYDII